MTDILTFGYIEACKFLHMLISTLSKSVFQIICLFPHQPDFLIAKDSHLMLSVDGKSWQ